jgi:hypothetical protein
MQSWGDESIKKIMVTLAAEGIKISISTDIWYSYSYVSRGENGIFLFGITGCVIIEGLWSVRWSGYDITGDKMVTLDLEVG